VFAALTVIAPFLIREMSQFYGGSTDNDATLVFFFEKFNKKLCVRSTYSDCALSYPGNAQFYGGSTDNDATLVFFLREI
jgi:hypothetical protein